MSKPIVLLGDMGLDHEGFPPTPVTAGSPDVFVDGKPVARVGDPLAPHSKPKHPPHPRVIASGSTTVLINGVPAAITGGTISCGGFTMGSGSVVIGDTHTPHPVSPPTPFPARNPAAVDPDDPDEGPAASAGSASAASASAGGSAAPASSPGSNSGLPPMGTPPRKPMLPRTDVGPNKQAQPGDALVELVYVPGEGVWYGLTADEVAELDQAAAALDEPVKALARAQASGDSEQVLAAKAELEAAVAPLVNGPDSNDLTEIVRLKGRKYTYIASDKMSNHWRSYRLDADDRKRRKLTSAGGELDLDKVRKELTQVEGKVQAHWAPDALKVDGAFTDWAERLNKQLKWQSDTTDEPARDYDATAEARLLRYYAGASLESDFSPMDGKVGFKGQLQTQLALAEGQAKAQGYYPDAKGHQPKFVPAGLEGRHEVQLGGLRGRFELLLAGFAGASALGAAKLEFAPQDGKLLTRGVDAETGVGASVFAGARLTCEARGHLEWANPDKGYEFKAFASAGYGAAISAGIGADSEFTVSFDQGRFMVRARAGVVCGVGATGTLLYVVDAALIWEFAAFMRHQLLDVRQEYQFLMEDFAYTVLVAAIARHKQSGDDLEQLIEDPLGLIEWWKSERYQIDDVLGLADNLKREDDALRYAPPATLGRWLEQLRRALEEGLAEDARKRIEDALMRLLNQLQDQLDWRFTLSHMTLNGRTLAPEQALQRLEATASQVRAPRLHRFLAQRQQALPSVAARNSPLGSGWVA